MAKQTDALALPEDFSLVAQVQDMAELQESLEGLEGNIDHFSLARLKTPSGGATQWSVEQADGSIDTPSVIRGVIIAATSTRQRYKQKYGEGGGGGQPDCSSTGPDALAQGVGDPGGPCADCALRLWVGDTNPTCQARRHLLICTQYGLLPYFLSVAPGSVSKWTDYLTKCVPVPAHRLITDVGLVVKESRSTSSPIKYSQVTFAKAGVITDPKEIEFIDGLRHTLGGVAQAAAADEAAAVVERVTNGGDTGD